MILVRGPWYETPSSLDLLFTLNRGMSFLGVFEFWDLYVVVCFPTYFLNKYFCRENSERYIGKLGGKSWLQEDLKVIRDFRAGMAS